MGLRPPQPPSGRPPRGGGKGQSRFRQRGTRGSGAKGKGRGKAARPGASDRGESPRQDGIRLTSAPRGETPAARGQEGAQPRRPRAAPPPPPRPRAALRARSPADARPAANLRALPLSPLGNRGDSPGREQPRSPRPLAGALRRRGGSPHPGARSQAGDGPDRARSPAPDQGDGENCPHQ